MFRTRNTQGGFATVTKVHLAASGRHLPTEDLASSTMDAEQVSQEHIRLAYYFQKHRPPSKFAALAVSACKDLTSHHLGHQGFQQLTRGMQSEDSQCIPEPVMYGIYRPVATSVSNTCMCSKIQESHYDLTSQCSKFTRSLCAHSRYSQQCSP